jgi:hypothetical protein
VIRIPKTNNKNRKTPSLNDAPHADKIFLRTNLSLRKIKKIFDMPRLFK